VADVDQGLATQPRWAPDGNQFTFLWLLGVPFNPALSLPPRGERVMLSNLGSGGTPGSDGGTDQRRDLVE
jgi:hypothetical protein